MSNLEDETAQLSGCIVLRKLKVLIIIYHAVWDMMYMTKQVYIGWDDPRRIVHWHKSMRMTSSSFQGCLHVRYKSLHLNVLTWEEFTNDHPRWRQILQKGMKWAEEKEELPTKEKHVLQKENSVASAESSFKCSHCTCDCYSLVDLFSHSRGCSTINRWPDFFRHKSMVSFTTDRCLLHETQ